MCILWKPIEILCSETSKIGHHKDIQDTEYLKTFNYGNYEFDAKATSEKEFMFVRWAGMVFCFDVGLFSLEF